MNIVLNKEIGLNKSLSRSLSIAAFVIMITLGAFVRIPLPFTPVPITLQTFFVLLSAAALSSAGVWPQVIYICLGVIGLPIFTGFGSGILYLLGPTGGYLFGFIIAAIFLSRMLRYAKNFFISLVFFSLASMLILLCGTIWLHLVLRVSFTKAFLFGFLPFFTGDIFKSALVALIYTKIKE